MSTQNSNDSYYVPSYSYWPIVGCLALLCIATGLVQSIHEESQGPYLLSFGVLTLMIMFTGWFSDVIKESMSGQYSSQMNKTFRLGMLWFIFSEIWFFGAFFGVLFYARRIALPMLSGTEGFRASTHAFLYPEFVAQWPLLMNPNPKLFPGPRAAMGAMGIPAINTFLLLMSGLTITIAHYALLKKQKTKTALFIAMTVFLGWLFLGFQVFEYRHAYEELKLTLNSGIYASTFYFLTGFHGLHVFLGTVMLFCILFRTLRGHFQGEHHFAFEAAAWYWHFVDVIWLFLFICVYWL